MLSDDPDIAALRGSTSPEKVQRALEIMSPLDAVRYVPHTTPTPLLFQFATFERFFDKPSMERYFAAASQPKQIFWYDTGHELNDPRALLDRSQWPRQHLGMPSIAPPLTTDR